MMIDALVPKPAPPCKHGYEFITRCPDCTPPLEKGVEHMCDRLMLSIGWRVVRISQPRRTMQTEGIPDRRYYPPPGNPDRHSAFWFEVKREGGRYRKGQLEFELMCEDARDPHCSGGLKELAEYLREHRIKEVGIL